MERVSPIFTSYTNYENINNMKYHIQTVTEMKTYSFVHLQELPYPTQGHNGSRAYKE